MPHREYLAVVVLAVGVLTDNWAARRTVLKALQACPNVKDFTYWFKAIEKGNASRAIAEYAAAASDKFVIEASNIIQRASANRGALIESRGPSARVLLHR
jgi:hypothetical protein